MTSVPRVTREIIALIADRGKMGDDYYHSGNVRIIPQALEKFLNISTQEMILEINILENANLVYVDENQISERIVYFLTVNGEMINNLLYWMKENNLCI